MNDFSPSSTATIYLNLEELGVPITGATITVTITNPAGTEIVSAAGVYEEGGGLYSYTLTAAQTTTLGTYFVDWSVTAPTTLVEKTSFTVGYEAAYALTVLDLRHLIAATVEGKEAFYTGAVDSGSTSTSVVDADRVEPSGELVGCYLYICAGTARGQERRVTAFTSPTMTVGPAFTTTPVAADRYELHRIFSKDDFDRALRMAYFDVAKLTLVPISYSGYTIVSGQSEYDIPAGFSHIYQVEVDVGNDTWIKTAPGVWSIVRPLRKLRLHPNLYYDYAGCPMRILGLRPPTDPLEDDTGVDVDPNYLVCKSAAFLALEKMKQPGDAWYQKYLIWERKAEMSKAEMNKSVPNNTKRVE